MEYISIGAPNPVGKGVGVWCKIYRNREHRSEKMPFVEEI